MPGIHASFFMSDASLAGRNLKMMNVTAYGHLDAAGEGLEDTFYLMMLVHTLGTDIQIHAGSVAQALEEMEEHLGRHVANLFTGKGGVPYQPGPSAEIE